MKKPICKKLRLTKVRAGLAILVMIGMLVSCWWGWVPIAIIAYATLFEFFGQYIHGSTSHYYYNVGETVTCEIRYHVSQSNKFIHIEIIDDVTGTVVDNGSIYPLIQYGFHDVEWSGDPTTYPGYFRCHAEMRDYGENDNRGWQGSTFYFVVGEGGQTFLNMLGIWSGTEGKGNPNEKISLQNKTGHVIAVQIEGSDHNSLVDFTSSDCTFEYTGLHNVPRPQVPIEIDGLTYYLAYTWVMLPDDQPIDGAANTYTIQASQPVAHNSVIFCVHSLRDGERSHDIGLYTHQANSGIEITGDNYYSVLDNNGNPVIDYGDANDYKDVMIELDWYDWGGVTLSIIQEIADSIKKVLCTAGIDTVASIIIGDEIPMDNYPNRQQRMSLFAQHKEALSNYDRMWLNRIHVILGSNCQGDTIGITDMYPEYGTVNAWWTMHLGSGALGFSAPYLDSVGCFVFADAIESFPNRQLDLNSAIALVAAHEIGHALGMSHYPVWYGTQFEPHVMADDFRPMLLSASGFQTYGRFLPKTLDGSYDLYNILYDGMNTRHVLGINCVNSVFEGW